MNRKRRGYTLIEMVMIAVLSAFVLGTAIAATAMVTGLSTITGREVDFYRELGRLANAFRDDVHRATEVTVKSAETLVGSNPGGTVICEMKLGDGRVARYLTQNGLVREVRQDNKLMAREGFELDRGQRVRVERREKDSHVFAHLFVYGSPLFEKGDRNSARDRVWEIRAAVGRDQL